jgi:hypothetical protein
LRGDGTEEAPATVALKVRAIVNDVTVPTIFHRRTAILRFIGSDSSLLTRVVIGAQ